MKLGCLLFCSLFMVDLGFSQIKLANASFEGIPKDATTPAGWVSCGPSTTPDILPGYWGVNKLALEGKTFLGLTTREDNTWEYISQGLSHTLEKNQCYLFSVGMARSETYARYNRPIVLKIWAGTEVCKKEQLLAQSDLVAHNEWKNYEFLLIPNRDYQYIILEAYYADDTIFPYKGNFLLDNCSVINVCDRVDLPQDEPERF